MFAGLSCFPSSYSLSYCVEWGTHLSGKTTEWCHCCLPFFSWPLVYPGRRSAGLYGRGRGVLHSTIGAPVWLMLCCSSPGKVSFFSEGLLFVHCQYGSVTLCREHLCAVRFYQPVKTNPSAYIYDPCFPPRLTPHLFIMWLWRQDCDGGVAALLVEYEAALLPHLPLALHGPQRHLLFGLPPGSAPSASLATFCSKVVMGSGSGLRRGQSDKQINLIAKESYGILLLLNKKNK